MAKRQYPHLIPKARFYRESLWKSLGKLWKTAENLVETLGNFWGKTNSKNKNCNEEKCLEKFIFGN